MQTITKKWALLSLAQQFTIGATLVLIINMMVIGIWVSGKIESAVINNTASVTALYVDSFVAPALQELARGNKLSETTQKTLNLALSKSEFGERIWSFKIWLKNGLIVFSSHKELIGVKFEPTDHLKRAWTGAVSAEFERLHDQEDRLERESGVPLLEVYAPVRETSSDRIIAVAEFYAVANVLQDDLFHAKLQSWLVVAILTMTALAALFLIVRKGNQMIEHQRVSLERRVSELSTLLSQNEELRNRVQQASRRTTEINEKFLRRIGADLHDGPAQLVSLALLTIDSLKPSGQLESMRRALSDSLQEIRDISSGLSLPEIEKLSLEETLRIAIRMHETRTGTKVTSTITQLPNEIARPIKICLYRFSQEALNNAFRHADAKGQKLEAHINGSMLEVTIQDSGKGFDPSYATTTKTGLGLNGMRERIESLGGKFDLRSTRGKGVCLKATFPTSIVEM